MIDLSPPNSVSNILCIVLIQAAVLYSGLNPDVDQESDDKDSHLCKLMEFCIDMQVTAQELFF